MSKWTYTLDGDKIHPDWEHTLDGEYRPKSTTYSYDYDLVVDGKTTSQEELDEIRKKAVIGESWM